MTRPKNADPEQTQRRILTTAIELFGAQGSGDTSIRAIAASAGVTLATVHHYFGSKEALFERCIDAAYSVFNGLQAELTAVLAEGDPAIPNIIDRVVRCAFRFAARHAETGRFLLRVTVFEPNGPHRQRMAQAQRDYLDMTSQVFGGLMGVDPRSLRVPMQGMMFLLTRMAVITTAELEVIGTNVADTRKELEDYVSKVAVASLLGLPQPNSIRSAL